MADAGSRDDTGNKREKILTAAYQVFSKKGYNRATVDEIVNLADTGKGTVYNYFDSKEHLFYTIIRERSEPLEQSLEGVVAEKASPIIKIRQMIEILLDFYLENGELWRVVLHEMRGVMACRKLSQEQRQRYDDSFSRIVGMIEGVLEQGKTEGVFRAVDMEKLACSIFSVIVMMTFQNFVTDVQAGAEYITDMFLYGAVARATQ